MGEKTPWQHTLVFAIAHEIGNHLGAIRLQAHLLGLEDEQGPGALTESSLTIDNLAGRAGPLLALLRPILSPVASIDVQAPRSVSWSGLLEGLDRQIASEGTQGVHVEISPASNLEARAPAVDWLQPLLMALVGSTLDTASRGDTIWLRLDPRGDELALVIEDGGVEEDLSREAPLRGRALCVSIARRLLEPFGGRLVVRRIEQRTRLELILPNLD